MSEVRELAGFIEGFFSGPALTEGNALAALHRAAANPAAREQLAGLLVDVPLDTKARLLAGKLEASDVPALRPMMFPQPKTEETAS